MNLMVLGIKVSIYTYSFKLTFQNVMHDVRHQSINNMEVLTIIKDRFICNSIGCCNVASERTI